MNEIIITVAIPEGYTPAEWRAIVLDILQAEGVEVVDIEVSDD